MKKASRFHVGARKLLAREALFCACRQGVVLALALFCLATALRAQSAPAAAPKSATPPAHHARKKHALKSAKAEAEAPQRPALPPMPDWPANDKAQPASVAWNGRDLTIAATNSSLSQILHEVSTATGLKVEGYESASGSRDERIYGSYGPASARVVLGQLLDGSGYNVIMVGDRGSDTPRELLITSQPAGAGVASSHPDSAHQNHEEEPAEEPEQPEPPPATAPGIRTPEQMRQELMQRQQQQQFPGNPPLQPPPQ